MLRADRGYDADWIRALAICQGAWANIPPKGNRKDPICFSRFLYRERNLVERFFNKIKHCRRVATRYDKLAANYLAFVKLACIRLWLRVYGFTAYLANGFTAEMNPHPHPAISIFVYFRYGGFAGPPMRRGPQRRAAERQVPGRSQASSRKSGMYGLECDIQASYLLRTGNVHQIASAPRLARDVTRLHRLPSRCIARKRFGA
jgi:transposase